MRISNAYIKEILIDNYKSLKNSKIDLLNGLNIIIGKNGAGKSNLLDFIYRFASRSPLSNARISRQLNTNYSVTISYLQNRKINVLNLLIERFKKSDNGVGQNVTINKSIGASTVLSDKKINLGDPELRKRSLEREELLKELQPFQQIRCRYITYELPEMSAWLSNPSRFTIDKENNISKEENYSIFGFLFGLEISMEVDLLEGVSKKIRNNDLQLKHYIRNWLDKYLESLDINTYLRKYTTIKEIRFNPNINIYSNDEVTIIENLSIEFLIGNDWMPWSYLSDGTKRLFYLVSEVVLYTGMILIEEPELGIHPHQLYKIIDFLKEQSRTKQIVISTHSPLVLDGLNDEELNRIIIAENKKGTKFNHLTKAQIAKAKNYMQEVGELSYYWLHSDLEI